MGRVLVCLLLVLGLSSLYGCDQLKLPDWLKFAQPKPAGEPQSPPAATEGTLLFSVNGRVISLEEFNRRVEGYNSEIQAAKDIPDSVKPNYLIDTAEERKRLLEGMVERELLISEALDRGMDKEKEVLKAIETLKEELLFVKILEAEKAKQKVDGKEVEEYYNLRKDAFQIPEERKISMIVVPSEARAKELLIQLLQGADFATLARENSTDQSAASGGDIGFIVQKLPFPQPEKKTMFKKFEEVAFSLELNKPSTVFEGPSGFYIIKVTELKESRQMLLSEVYNDIEQGLLLKKQQDALNSLIGNLRKTGNVIVREELLESK